jgi:glycerophosphoryl diester phosphodiesterase
MGLAARTTGGVLATMALLACGGPTAVHDPPAETANMVTSEALNIAHRGASAHAPEHTLAAYKLALEMGADFVEQDLQLTRDGVLVCLHDETLERTTNVEEIYPGRAVEVEIDGESRPTWPVSGFTLEEIRRLDAGSWFGAEFAGQRIPTFQEAIDLVRGRAGIYPETKVPDVREAPGFELEAELVRVLAANGLDTSEGQAATPVFIQSFSPESLQRVRELTGSTYRLIQLVSREEAGTLMSDRGLGEVASYADGVGPALPILLLDPMRARAARALGLEVHPYTVRADRLPVPFCDATALMRFLITDIGATGVFTDNPDLFPGEA